MTAEATVDSATLDIRSVTMRFGGATSIPISYPLSRLEIGFDHAQNRLQVFLYEDR